MLSCFNNEKSMKSLGIPWESAGYGIFFGACVFHVFFLVDLSAKTTKPEVDISTWKDTQGRGRRVVQLAEAARETRTGCYGVPYLEMIWRPNMDDTCKDSPKKWVKSQSCRLSLMFC